MISPEKLERYRKMTPEERWQETEELMTLAWRALQELPEDERRRRLEFIRREHEAGNRLLLERLGKFH